MGKYRINTQNDVLLAEIIITLRQGFGMPPAYYDPVTAELVIDDGKPEPEEAKPEEPEPEPEPEPEKPKSKPGPKPKDKE